MTTVAGTPVSTAGTTSSTTTSTTAPVPATVPPDLAAFGLEEISVAGQRWLVAVADVAAERFQGLRRVADLGALDGMLFVWESDTETSFTMRTVPIPLEVGLFDGDGRLLEVVAMAPCGDRDDCPLYSGSSPFRYAVERPAGGWEAVPIGSLLVREN